MFNGKLDICLLFSDDDTYLDNEDDLEKHLINEVGTIWRGTSRQPRPLLWEYGQVKSNTVLHCSYACFHEKYFLLQYSKGCLDVALQLLQGLSADERRSAATIAKNIVAQVAIVTSALIYFCQVYVIVEPDYQILVVDY